jgi:hypothetical protein
MPDFGDASPGGSIICNSHESPADAHSAMVLLDDDLLNNGNLFNNERMVSFSDSHAKEANDSVPYFSDEEILVRVCENILDKFARARGFRRRRKIGRSSSVVIGVTLFPQLVQSGIVFNSGTGDNPSSQNPPPLDTLSGSPTGHSFVTFYSSICEIPDASFYLGTASARARKIAVEVRRFRQSSVFGSGRPFGRDVTEIDEEFFTCSEEARITRQLSKPTMGT